MNNLKKEESNIMKQPIFYKVVSLPINRDRLSPQLQLLVETIEEQMVDEKVSRDEIYESWLKKINSDENDKVFASYIHQLIQFSFLDRTNVKEKKIPTVDEVKKMMSKQLSLMSKEDRELFLKSLN